MQLLRTGFVLTGLFSRLFPALTGDTVLCLANSDEIIFNIRLKIIPLNTNTVSRTTTVIINMVMTTTSIMARWWQLSDDDGDYNQQDNDDHDHSDDVGDGVQMIIITIASSL